VVERRRSAEPPLREAAGVVGQNRSRLEFPSSRFGFVSDFFLVRLVRKTWLLFAMVACTGQVALGASIPWKVYNEGVEAYAKGDYTNALQQWQELSVQKISGWASRWSRPRRNKR
jgi:hypothetical protein